MSASDTDARIAEIRAAFDHSFALPADDDAADTIDVVLLSVGPGADTPGQRTDHRLAAPVADLSGIRICPPITPIPGQAAGFGGVVGVRGELVAVFDLSRLIDDNGRVGGRDWLLLAGRDPMVGLTFGSLDGYQQVRREAIYGVGSESAPAAPASGGPRLADYGQGLADIGGQTYEIIAVARWVDALVASEQPRYQE